MASAVQTRVRSTIRGGVDGRVRATWRILVPIALLALVGTPLAFAPVAATGIDSVVFAHALSGVMIALLTGVVLYGSKRLDRRSLSGYGVALSRRAGLEFAAGIAFGIGMTGFVFAASYALGLIRLEDLLVAGAQPLLVAIPLLALGWLCWAAMEEVLFRGIVIPNATEGLAARGLTPARAIVGAVLASSVLFAVPHVFLSPPPEAVLTSLALVSWTIGGLLYGVAFVLTGNLAFPIGLHATGNVATNLLFLGGVTGDEGMPAAIQVTATEPGRWFPIHGLVDIVVTLVAIGVLVGWVYWRRGELSPVGASARWTLEADDKR